MSLLEVRTPLDPQEESGADARGPEVRNVRLAAVASGLVSNNAPRASAGEVLVRSLAVSPSTRQLRPAVDRAGTANRKAEGGVRYLHSIMEMWAEWYRGSLERQRHAVEVDARRLGGKVSWIHNDGSN